MDRCKCQYALDGYEKILTVECLECSDTIVRCPQCGRAVWWPHAHRRRALNAADAHRWDSGHQRIMVLGFSGAQQASVVTEVLGY